MSLVERLRKLAKLHERRNAARGYELHRDEYDNYSIEDEDTRALLIEAADRIEGLQHLADALKDLPHVC